MADATPQKPYRDERYEFNAPMVSLNMHRVCALPTPKAEDESPLSHEHRIQMRSVKPLLARHWFTTLKLAAGDA